MDVLGTHLKVVVGANLPEQGLRHTSAITHNLQRNKYKFLTRREKLSDSSQTYQTFTSTYNEQTSTN